MTTMAVMRVAMTKRPGLWLAALGLVAIAACSDAPSQGAPAPAPRPVVTRSDAASAAECPNGGSVVSAGFDVNGNGVLDDGEATSRSVVCLDPGASANVVGLAPEPPGANCSTGGTAVRSGPDRNGNGVLDGDEVAHVEYACGQVLLGRIAATPRSARCPLGGVAFVAGRDRDRDGLLEDGEIETRSEQCGDVIAGSVVLHSNADLEAIRDVRVIRGDLFVDYGTTTDLLDVVLPKLEHAGQVIVFGGGDSLNIQLALPELREIDGQFFLQGPHVHRLACPKLQRTGSLLVSFTPLTDLAGLSALTTIDGDVAISSNPDLVSADLPVRSIGGNVVVDFNPNLVGLRWALQGRVGDVEFLQNFRATELDISVTPIGDVPAQIGSVFSFSNFALTQVAVRADRADAVQISETVVTDIALAIGAVDGEVRLFSVGPAFRVRLSPGAADHISLGKLCVSGSVDHFELAAPLSVRDALLFDKTLLPSFAPGHAVDVAGSLTLTDNAQLASVAPLNLAATTRLTIGNNALLSRIDFLNLQDHQIGGIDISNQPALVDAPSLAQVAVVHGDVSVRFAPALAELFGPVLQRVEGRMQIFGNDGLRALRYPALEHVTDVSVSSCSALQTIDLSALPETSTITINDNTALHHLALDALSEALAVVVGNNPVLPACEVLAIFAHVTSNGLSQSGNDDLATCVR